VIVIGAGMAGLAAALELAGRGHEPIVLEAQNRVGGRILTLRTFAPGLYAEAGAMRIPRVHKLTLEYCQRFGLALRPFVMDCPEAPVYLGGERVTLGEIERDPNRMPLRVATNEESRTWKQLWDDATRDVRTRYESEGDAALESLGRDFDMYSIRDFLLERGFSEDALELYGLMSFRESNMRASVVEQLREIVGRAFEDMQEVAGGMDRLPQAMYAELRSGVRFGAQVYGVDQGADGVAVRYRVPSGDTLSVGADYCICTIPFGILRHVDFRPGLSRGKYRAIRELNYNPSTKILLQVRTRFWEKQGIVGGATVTDLPIRRIVYPSHAPEDGDPRGVLLASYTWGQDAARWGALNREDRIELAIRDVAKIHPEIREECEGGDSYSWYDDRYAVGAFALFEPGQETSLQPHIVQPEGRVHFAGEHCSLWHAWIQGALESGIDAAVAVDRAA
jgi:monoamine oxidase